MTRPIIRRVSYTAQCAPEGVELVVETEFINFVREMIPDGQLAGMMGHREVPGTDTMTYQLHPVEAKDLMEQLNSAIRNWESQWGRP